MKMKLLFIILIILFISYISYKNINKEELNITYIGDNSTLTRSIESMNYSDIVYSNYKDKIGFYNKYFTYNKIGSKELLDIINQNKKENDVLIQEVLHKSNVIIINLNEKVNKNNVDKINNNIDKIIKKINRISDANIIIIGIFNKDNNVYVDNLNKKIKEKDIIYIDNNSKKDEYLYFKREYYLTNTGNMYFSKQIISKIDNLYLKK